MATIPNARRRGAGWEGYLKIDGRVVSKGGFKTARQASAWVTETRNRSNRGETITPGRVPTVRAYWTKLDAHRRARLAYQTVERNETHWRLYLDPAFGDRRLDEVRRSDVRAFVADLVERGKGAATIEACLRLLVTIYETAVDDDLVDRNPARKVKGPSVKPAEKRWIGPAEVDAITATIEDDTDRLMIELLAWTGLRFQELAAITRDAVDFRGATIRVRSALDRNPAHKIKDPKNDPSRRTVPVPDHLRDRLREHLAGLRPDALVFTGRRGGYLDDRNVNERVLAPACEKAGVERVTLHHLRHFFVSIMVASGTSLTEVARLVGHADTRMIERTYAHLRPDVNDRALTTIRRVREGGL